VEMSSCITASPTESSGMLFQVIRRLVEAGVGLGPRPFGLQHQPGGQMEGAIRMEGGTLLLHRHMGVDAAFEVFLLELLETGLDVLTQGVADIEILTGDFDLHGRRKYPCFARVLHMGAFQRHVNRPFVTFPGRSRFRSAAAGVSKSPPARPPSRSGRKLVDGVRSVNGIGRT